MDQRAVDFVRCLRAAGIRVSLAEAQDAFQAMDSVGVFERAIFMEALRATLVKEHKDWAAFDYFFPLFFDQNTPPMVDMTQELSPEQQQMLQQALQSLLGSNEALQRLLDKLQQGQPFSGEELDQMGQHVGLPNANSFYQQSLYDRRMQREAALDQVRDLIEQLMEALREMGMSDAAREEIREMMEANADALAEQLANYTGLSVAERVAEQEPEPKPDVMDMPFQQLTPEEANLVRDEIRRLAVRLRARAALRQRRASDGQLDPKRTIATT
ncbi:MAG: hypothetical protein HC915_07660 [Anaerolineae bacterium]|nr:hypothetical protein [Anaerolineae bacterium]